MMFVSSFSNTTGATCGAGTANPSGAHDVFFVMWSTSTFADPNSKPNPNPI